MKPLSFATEHGWFDAVKDLCKCADVTRSSRPKMLLLILIIPQYYYVPADANHTTIMIDTMFPLMLG